jgi:release factor glutamine methyltransferase
MIIRETQEEKKKLLAPPSPSCFIDTPSLDAALLLADTLRARREDLIVRADDNVTEQDRENFLRLIERRRSGECAAYILGRREFRGLEFAVSRHVLVPRPDTETLAEAALEYIDSRDQEKLSLLDLCAGSGVLAVSLKNERPFLSLAASDISAEALETAALNASRLLDGPVRFIESDLFENIPGRFDLIVSNPPYIPTGELSGLAPEVRMEPRLALDGGEDGLELIKKIIPQAAEHLLPGGALFLEAGPEQMPAIRALLETHGFTGIALRKDLAGRDRVISGKLSLSKNVAKGNGKHFIRQ